MCSSDYSSRPVTIAHGPREQKDSRSERIHMAKTVLIRDITKAIADGMRNIRIPARVVSADLSSLKKSFYQMHDSVLYNIGLGIEFAFKSIICELLHKLKNQSSKNGVQRLRSIRELVLYI